MQERVRTATVAPEPYDWPWQGELDIARTALLLVDWQTAACQMVTMQGRGFGAVATSEALLRALAAAPL